MRTMPPSKPWAGNWADPLMPVLELLQAGLAGRLQPPACSFMLVNRSFSWAAVPASTLLGLCNGALQPDQGQLLWKGRPLNQRSRRQRCQLEPVAGPAAGGGAHRPAEHSGRGTRPTGWLWAIRNLLGWLDPAPHQQCAQVGLDQELLHQSVQQLSGGERQRVALARLRIRSRSWSWPMNRCQPSTPCWPMTC